ncbi:MAG: hypothetical protein CVT78_13865 [Alphaproteobacteria bacterium HGW-Alphaproteobacteria-17]|nr:MAG: hypothetical protein CVT78_13865 [Alphaproteobacteria bacterium HGW-Alphaproteobacteria-17]
MGEQKVEMVIEAEMAAYRERHGAADVASAWRALERAHILSQPFLVQHLASHWHMFSFAVALRDWREAAGQLFRLALVPLGSLTGRLPVGNTGRARVSAFRPMPMPSDLAALLSAGDKPAQT